MLDRKNLISSSPTVDVYADGDTVVKLFKEDMPKTACMYEALTHARVEATDLPVPKIREIFVVDNRWAIRMDRIEGKTLAEIMKEDPGNVAKYVEQMVDIQLKIHAQAMPKLSKLKDKLARQINSLDTIDATKRYDLLTRLESMPKHTKLCHGNFSPENIIINDKGIYILDWVAARQGNASADVARTYLLFSLNSKDVADMYMDTFCAKTKTSKKYVQEWLPIVAAAELVEQKACEEEMLMKWIDVVAYE